MSEETTPGPWIVGPYGAVWTGIARDQSGKWDEVTADSARIVATPSNPADCHLVAAAPDLFAAADEAHAFMSIVMPTRDTAEALRIVAKLRAALTRSRASS